MTDTSPNNPAAPLSDFRAAQATLSIELHGTVRVDSFQVISYDQGQFSVRTQVVGGPGPLGGRALTPEEMRGLLSALKAESHNPPADLDALALRTFIEALTHAVEHAPSTRFDRARFGNITTDASGAIVGYLVLGVDVVGTIHDADHTITFEQHPVPLPPGPFRPLSRADRASLAKVLKNFMASAQSPVDPLWSQVLSDLQE